MDKNKIFINLTSGIEAIGLYSLPFDKVSFIRIQSSHCEAHKWEDILLGLDDNFLMHLAMGFNCIIYDFGSHTNNSKALYIGMEWIKYFLARRWFHRDYKPVVKGKDITNYYEKEYEKISGKTKRKIDYFRNFLFVNELSITTIASKTEFDNQKEFYRNAILKLISE